ncbi:uncharacterized protein EV154DRAFT_512792 [Mucor mucedo]|uniref:uncharacterized protein n=1 Tax=Mucor mucedo TaxID=29922 RepID=UPI00221E9150|nr:uncharacterized protein EV154DRAFT_512792 [Mucor mucedo]KAI7889906.1 hypothetical protein EV154DRAFT_512792 [Mucor mucedo]
MFYFFFFSSSSFFCIIFFPFFLFYFNMFTEPYPNDMNFSYTENNKNQNVGRAVIHQYKSSHALQHVPISPPNQLHSLTHCKKCDGRIHEPITLTCGFTLCRRCLPTTPSQCLSFSCLRTHSIDERERTTTRLLEDILSRFDPTQDKSDYLPLFDCSICLSTLTEPITTQCGHTFCKECLIRSMTDLPSRNCPYCRTQLDRIGKINQLVSGWLNYLNHTLLNESPESIPIIQITGAVGFPTQHCLICEEFELS